MRSSGSSPSVGRGLYVAVATSPASAASSSESSKGETMARRLVLNCLVCGARRARLNDVTEHAVAMQTNDPIECLIVVRRGEGNSADTQTVLLVLVVR